MTDPSVAEQAGGLFLAPFIHENIAIVTAAILITSHQLPRWIALASLYCGMTTSDLALYGAGALARRNRHLRNFLFSRGNRRLSTLLSNNMALAVIAARLIPGMIMPSYVACGWVGLPFRRFFVLCLVSAAVYLPIALGLALAFGEATTRYFGYWAWAGLILPLMAAGFIGSRLFKKRASALTDERPLASSKEDDAAELEELPPALGDFPVEGILPASRRPYSRFEFWPGFVFYTPVYLYIAWQMLRRRGLALPALANPAMENGGLWGESKSALLARMDGNGRTHLAPYVVHRRGDAHRIAHDVEQILARCEAASIGFPFVAKPDLGCQGNGVQIIASTTALHDYVAAFPSGEGLMVQQLIDKPGEAGIFYMRHPAEAHGRVSSMTLKFAPEITGDGISTIEQLVRADPRAGRVVQLYLKPRNGQQGRIPAQGEPVRLVFVGNHCKGSIFRDASAYVTPALADWIDNIALGIPDFYFGRFDLRFSSLADLQSAKDLAIIEFNGGASEATHIWDPDMTLRRAYGDHFAHIRAMFAIGAANRRRGHKARRADKILLALRAQSRLMKRYPAYQ
jgi:membrane protein DedA with SNARE-associated domain